MWIHRRRDTAVCVFAMGSAETLCTVQGIETPITYNWDAETVSVQSSRGTGQRRWNDLRKVKENDRLVLLYTTDVLFEVVPKGWFSNAAQLDQFRAYAHGRSET